MNKETQAAIDPITSAAIEAIEGIAKREIERLLFVAKSKRTEWPQVGDKYWWVSAAGLLENSLWKNEYPHINSMEVGNIFHTEQNAEAHIQYLKTHEKLRKLAGDFVPNWSDVTTKKYYICWDSFENNMDWNYNYRNQSTNTIYFREKTDLSSIPADEIEAYLTYSRQG